MNTAIPGILISWDGKLAVVKPTMPMQLADGTILPAPQIVSVPVCWPCGDGGKALVTVPLKAGDDVLLIFSQRSIENWLSGSDQAPDDPRRFDLSDAFATPCMRPIGGVADTENLSVQYGKGSMKITPDGSITINAPQTTINSPVKVTGDIMVQGTVTVSGDMKTSGGIKASGDVTAAGISTHNHTHPGDSGGTTGAPQ